MSEEHGKRSRAWIASVLVILSLLYPISFGPAVQLGIAYEDGFYKPMWALYDSKTYGDAVQAYLRFWYGLIGPCGRWPIRS